MSIEVRFRRGTALDHSTFTGANGEITIDTTHKTAIVHDGVTQGGFRLAKFSDINQANLQSVSTSIVPSANVTYDLGTPELSWRDLYLSGGTIVLGGAQLKSDADSGSIVIIPERRPEDVEEPKAVVITKAGTIKSIDTANGTPDQTQLNTAIVEQNNNNFANVSITNLVLENVLGTEFGGTGLSSFTENGVMFASNTSVLGFISGSSGQIMQIGSDGVPKFDKLDGGDF